MKQIQTTKATILAVDVPDEAFELEVMGQSLNVSRNIGFHPFNGTVKLPKGNWKILSLANDLTEEQWKRIVEEITIKSNIIKSFRNYERKMPQWIYACSTATESGHSLLKANGIVLSNPLGEKPQPFSYVKWDVQARAEKEWQQAQSKVTNPLILIKV